MILDNKNGDRLPNKKNIDMLPKNKMETDF